MAEVSTKPYHIRAIYQWCIDQGFTPYLAVAVDATTRVPAEFVREGQIVLNLSPLAVHALELGNEVIRCSARFGGVAREIHVPVGAVVAIYARENNQGMAFELGTSPSPSPATASPQVPSPPGPGKSRGKAALRRVK